MPSSGTIALPDWPTLPERPALPDGALDLIWIDLDAAADEPEALLDESERERAARFHSSRARRRWVAARGALRGILARYLDAEARSLRFVTGERGKPSLPGDGLAFNLSHSQGTGMCAVSSAGEVGVDLEIRERRVDEVAIAARILGADTAARLRALDPTERERELLRAWVRHEADRKRLGIGIAAPIPEGARSGWGIDWEVGPRAAAAVSSDAEPSALRRWRWDPGGPDRR